MRFERVLVVTAHPDDPEFLAGGTVVRLVREGAEVSYVIVSDGGKGSSDPTITRERLATEGFDHVVCRQDDWLTSTVPPR